MFPVSTRKRARSPIHGALPMLLHLQPQHVGETTSRASFILSTGSSHILGVVLQARSTVVDRRLAVPPEARARAASLMMTRHHSIFFFSEKASHTFRCQRFNRCSEPGVAPTRTHTHEHNHRGRVRSRGIKKKLYYQQGTVVSST